jgi:hypothetical protein
MVNQHQSQGYDDHYNNGRGAGILHAADRSAFLTSLRLEFHAGLAAVCELDDRGIEGALDRGDFLVGRPTSVFEGSDRAFADVVARATIQVARALPYIQPG